MAAQGTLSLVIFIKSVSQSSYSFASSFSRNSFTWVMRLYLIRSYCQSGRWRTQEQDKTWLSPAYTLDSAPSGIAGVSATYDLVSRDDYQFCAVFRNYFRSYTDSWPGRNMLSECSVIRGGANWQLRVRADIGVTQCQAICAD